MDIFSTLQPATDGYLQVAGNNRDIPPEYINSFDHPQEDYLLTNQNPPVFVVADGVTLDVEKLVENSQEYPDPSPSGRVAQIFCESIIEYCTDSYTDFDKSNTRRAFVEANQQVRGYNKTAGSKELVNNPTGQFAATGAFMVRKNDTVYWATICDSFFAHFDSDMNQKFMSSGSCDPYAVINGESRMVDLLEVGSVSVSAGDKLFLFTDGFEHYLKSSEFQDLFVDWDSSLKKQTTNFSENVSKKDPEKYGRERSLIAVQIN